MLNSALRENVRKTALQIIEEKGIVVNTDISKKLNISDTSAALYLHKNYKNWNLGRENIAFQPSHQRWVYYKLGTDDSTYLTKYSEALKKAKEEFKLKVQEIKMAKKAFDRELFDQKNDYFIVDKRQEESLPQRIDKMIDKLHREVGKVDFTYIRARLRKELGRKPNSDEIALALDIYEKGIKKGKYIWRDGYSIIST